MVSDADLWNQVAKDYGLNPCSNGIWSLTVVFCSNGIWSLTFDCSLERSDWSSLNPCSNGIWSLTLA